MVRKETRKDSLLRLISDIGGEGTREQINAKVPEYWELSDKELEIEKGVRKPLYWHRVASVCQSLKDRDHYLENPRRGVWKITEVGTKRLSSMGHGLPLPIQEKLIEIVAKILSDIKLTRKNSFSSRELHSAYLWQGLNYECDEIVDALKFLSTAPFSILQKQNDEYSLTGDIESILKKIGLLLQAFNKIGR